jgi:YfiH family protein
MSSRIDFIKPDLLNNEKVSSWFTLRNHRFVQVHAQIPGFNLGLNTSERMSVILTNRERLLDQIDVEPDQLAYAVQVHKTDVKEVTEGGVYEDTDGFVSSTPDLALAIQVADCAAVLLGDEENGVIGAAHAGWRGAVENIVPKTLSKMKALGAKPESIKVFVSPCISLKNFEVGEEVASEFPDQFVDRTNYTKPHVDLKAFIKHQLLSEGLLESHIDVDESCTISDEKFYSYRRQKEQSGRMMGIIKLNSEQ